MIVSILDRCIVRADGCVGWEGARDGRGYPHIVRQGKTMRVFRVLFEHFRGEIPAGLQLHHECHDKECVNPWHMRPVTRSVHYGELHDSLQRARDARRPKTHCRHGHEFTADNTYVAPGRGHRQCRACRTRVDKQRRARAAWTNRVPRSTDG